MAGGIRIPIPHAADTIAVARARLYPFAVNCGTMIPPIAAASAEVEPDTPEKNISAMTTTCPSPPGRCPTSDRASVTSRRLIPPTSMRKPARMKSGTASMGKESIPATICCGMMARGRSATTMATMAAIASAKPMGTAASTRRPKMPRRRPPIRGRPRAGDLRPTPPACESPSARRTPARRRRRARTANPVPQSVLPWSGP